MPDRPMQEPDYPCPCFCPARPLPVPASARPALCPAQTIPGPAHVQPGSAHDQLKRLLGHALPMTYKTLLTSSPAHVQPWHAQPRPCLQQPRRKLAHGECSPFRG
jgi:hypothetical protein